MSPMPRAYFERLYQHNPDPWGFATRWYEARKYGLTLAALPRARYRRAFEPGCSIGVLTEMLAGRCDALLAADVIAAGGGPSREPRLGLWPTCMVRQLALPEDWPDGHVRPGRVQRGGLLLRPARARGMLDRGLGSLESGGNWWPFTGGARPTTRSAGIGPTIIAARSDLAGRVHHVEDDFVLDVWERVAQ